MKSEDQLLTTLSFSDHIDLSPKEYVCCSAGNEAFEYCFNQNCKQEKIFMCGTRKCKCRESHGLCPKADLDFTLQHIKSKIIDTNTIKKHIESAFDKLIDQISDLREKIMAQVDKTVKYTLLHKIQKRFLWATSQESVQIFTPKLSSQLWNVINMKLVGKVDMFEKIKTQLQNYEILMLDSTNYFEKSFIQMIESQELVEERFKDLEVNKNLLETFKTHSSIVKENHMIEKLEAFFIPKKPNVIRLLFKASEHSFNLKTYYDICGDQTNTMIICQTNKDKILGGFSPIAFAPTSNTMCYAADESNSTFIFSLTQNDKFELKDKSKAVRHMPDKSHVRIGNAEFDICDKADSIQECYTYLTNQFYSNPKYKNEKESFQKLNGNDSFKFFTKEWEVWKIEFQQQNNDKEEN